MRMHLRNLGAGALALLLSVACKTMDSTGTAQNTYEGTEGSDEHVERLGDPSLARIFVMEAIKTERRDGRLFVQFQLRNTTNRNLPIEWNIAWMDASGFYLDTPDHWTPARIGGNGYQIVSRTAPDPRASAFRLGVRRPNTIR